MPYVDAGVLRRAATAELLPSRSARRALAVALFALLTAIGAYAAVPLPGTPVPVTLQTLFVSLAGVLLGPGLGAASQALYLAAGSAGLPVFAGGAGLGYLLGPTGGYLLAFPLAAWLTGRLAGASTSLPRLALAIALGTLVVFAGGAAQLALLTGDLGRAVVVGVLPFLVGDVVKIGLALLIGWRLRPRTLEQL